VTYELLAFKNQERLIACIRIKHLSPLVMVKGPFGNRPYQVQVFAIAYEAGDYLRIQWNVLNQSHLLPPKIVKMPYL
jgi:hypothetical protein